MTNNKATEALLGQLHANLAQAFLKKLENPEELTSSDANAIRQFLKDNGITSDPETDDNILTLVEQLPDFDKADLEEYA